MAFNRVRSWLLCIVLILLIGGVVLLFYTIDPAESVWMPKCVMKQLTGWDCPGCGFQRSLHAALHGEFSQALRYNYFFIVSVPFIASLAIGRWVLRGKARIRWARYVEHRYVVVTYIVMFFVWWVVRNL